MKLIVAEKPIAAARIASILGKPKKLLKNNVECFVLPDSVIVPLKGHITNVDFPAEYKSWGQTDLSKLVDAEIKYDLTQKNIGRVLEEYAPLCDELICATDYDSEGESIGKEAIEIIKKRNPKIKINTKRERKSDLFFLTISSSVKISDLSNSPNALSFSSVIAEIIFAS